MPRAHIMQGLVQLAAPELALLLGVGRQPVSARHTHTHKLSYTPGIEVCDQ